MKKTYVTKAEGKELSFNSDLKQVFHHESNQPKTLPEYTLVKKFIGQTTYEKQVCLEILKHLYLFTFATHDQLTRLLEQKGIDTDGLDEMIERMLETREMNSFYLSQLQTTDPAPEDAFIVYCMDFGAVAILSHFSTSDCITWFTTDVCRSSELIAKYLSTGEFYLALADARGSSLRYFKPIFDVNYKYMNIRLSAAFSVVQDNLEHSFILESVRNCDLPVNWRDKVDRKLTPFAVQERVWSKYFSGAEPVYIFLVEDEAAALETADIFYRRTEKENFRVITDQQVRKGLSNAYFLKYEPNNDPEQVGKLTKVKPSILTGEV